MFCALDVSYEDNSAQAACVLFSGWASESSLDERVCAIEGVEPYQPGSFFRRELPCLLRVLDESPAMPELLLIDGYVWLDGAGRPGLGARLYEHFDRRIAVVGVAKTAFHGARHAIPVCRGDSRRPLYITATGIDGRDAAAGVRAMYGRHRMPRMLQRADSLSRGSH